MSEVQVGTIAVQPGLPIHAEQWRWDYGFYPASQSGLSRSGYASSFDQARADFEAAWKDYLPRAAKPTSPNIAANVPSRPGNTSCTTPAWRT